MQSRHWEHGCPAAGCPTWALLSPDTSFAHLFLAPVHRGSSAHSSSPWLCFVLAWPLQTPEAQLPALGPLEEEFGPAWVKRPLLVKEPKVQSRGRTLVTRAMMLSEGKDKWTWGESQVGPPPPPVFSRTSSFFPPQSPGVWIPSPPPLVPGASCDKEDLM